ncbi:MAG TPA: hypothetical protein VL752_02095 [Acidisoma sp.]|jgi:hypothetical protein|uniref:hypothetical protein n=1 Tax=Acidisoma sp. TaxID=1872115 RepID=UPI002C1A5FAD|nr:hypothetical protein [Acidisoma sp.]HTH99711.1 hypothetical protein [Acidisoma sp.]
MIRGTALKGALLGFSFVAGSLLAGCALHHQGHMNSALDALNVAAAELGQTPPDKAGHVASALKYTQAAITEVEVGMSYKIKTGQQPDPAN